MTRTYSNPRRYSYYLGKGIVSYTPNKYLNGMGKVEDEKDLFNRFSVEVLTKAFYGELSDWYAWAIKEISFPNNLATTEDDTKYNHIGAIRLITRLIFVWFIKQRGLVPWQFFDEDYIRENLLDNFNPHTKIDLFYKATDSKYYRAILQNLFFAMLNAPLCKEGSKAITERKFKENRGQFDDNKLMRYKSLFKNPDLFLQLANSTVPFLNGGLFDCLDNKKTGIYYDGFSERKESIAQLRVPDYLFFGEEVGRSIDLSEYYGDANKKKVSARGIIDILKRYNFTVEENMPFDKDISLDPELLGKVFENLLASYNPETQTTARKQTGSFYTPREIVQYMVDESLVAHLNRTVGKDLEQEYRKLLSYSDDEIYLTEEQKQSIMESLYNCKVLDPACGSGAFPVGMLQQMVNILTRIDPDNSRWQKMLFEIAQDESSDVFKNSTEEERKEQLEDLYHSFNADFNRPDYSRKLYLIENCIYGVDIQPIAIQISKLRFFISLIIDQKPNNDPTDNFGIRPLPNLEAKFVAANTLIPLSKTTDNIGRTQDIIKIEDQLKEANHKIFYAKTSKTKNKWRDNFSQLKEKLKQSLKGNGFITNEGLNEIDSWNPYNQNTSASFFDAEWMFGVKDKFDIVIANPPFISYYSNTGSQLSEGTRELYVQLYDSVLKSNDRINSMNLMLEKGLSLLHKDGFLTYITNKTLAVLPSYIAVREYVLNHYKIDFIVQDISPFDAIVDNVIIGFTSKRNEESYQIKFVEPDLLHSTLHSVDLIKSNRLKEFIIPKNINIVQKIEGNTLRLESILMINRGVNIGGCFTDFLSKTKSNDTYRKYLPGTTNIKPYRYQWFEWDGWMKFDQRLEKKLKQQGKTIALGDPERYDQPRLFIPESSQTLVAAYCDQPYYSGYGLMVGTSKKKDYRLLKYACLLINSKLFTYYAIEKEILRKGNKATPHVGVKGLRSIPIPKINENTLNKIEEKVDLFLYEDSVSQDYYVYERYFDLLVYKLYDLTYDEVLIVDPETPISREEYEGFKI